MKNKTNKNKRVKISQKSIIDVATTGLDAISVEIAKFEILNGGRWCGTHPLLTVVNNVKKMTSELEDRLFVMKRDRAAQIGARAAKLS